jgi:hypothetical protein
MGNARTMKRQQERQEAKKVKKYWMTQQDIDNAIAIASKKLEEENKEKICDLANTISVAYIMILHDKFGFGQKRLERVHINAFKIFYDIKNKIITPELIKEWFDEKGIDYKLMQEKKPLI